MPADRVTTLAGAIATIEATAHGISKIVGATGIEPVAVRL